MNKTKKKKLPHKWRFAIGTTSRIPHDAGGFHYLMADFDGDKFPARRSYMWGLLEMASHVIMQRTPHGWHLYTDLRFDFNSLTQILEAIGADAAWVRIGKERGYYFLADKSEIDFPYPVEHMVLHGQKERRTLDSSRP